MKVVTNQWKRKNYLSTNHAGIPKGWPEQEGKRKKQVYGGPHLPLVSCHVPQTLVVDDAFKDLHLQHAAVCPAVQNVFPIVIEASYQGHKVISSQYVFKIMGREGLT